MILRVTLENRNFIKEGIRICMKQVDKEKQNLHGTFFLIFIVHIIMKYNFPKDDLM